MWYYLWMRRSPRGSASCRIRRRLRTILTSTPISIYFWTSRQSSGSCSLSPLKLFIDQWIINTNKRTVEGSLLSAPLLFSLRSVDVALFPPFFCPLPVDDCVPVAVDSFPAEHSKVNVPANCSEHQGYGPTEDSQGCSGKWCKETDTEGWEGTVDSAV